MSETYYITGMDDLPDGSVHTNAVATSFPPQDIFRAPNGDLYYVMQPMPEPIVHRKKPNVYYGLDQDWADIDKHRAEIAKDKRNTDGDGI